MQSIEWRSVLLINICFQWNCFTFDWGATYIQLQFWRAAKCCSMGLVLDLTCAIGNFFNFMDTSFVCFKQICELLLVSSMLSSNEIGQFYNHISFYRILLMLLTNTLEEGLSCYQASAKWLQICFLVWLFKHCFWFRLYEENHCYLNLWSHSLYNFRPWLWDCCPLQYLTAYYQCFICAYCILYTHLSTGGLMRAGNCQSASHT